MQAIREFFKNDRFAEHRDVELMEIGEGRARARMFVKAAKEGTLYAEAKEVSRNPKLGAYSIEVTDDAGDLVARFEGIVYRKKDPITPQG